MSSDHMSVRLHLCGLRVWEVSVDTPTRLEVVVELSAWRVRCPHCGFWCRRVHDRREKRIRDLSVSGRPCDAAVAAAPVRLWGLRRAPLGDPTPSSTGS